MFVRRTSDFRYRFEKSKMSSPRCSRLVDRFGTTRPFAVSTARVDVKRPSPVARVDVAIGRIPPSQWAHGNGSARCEAAIADRGHAGAIGETCHLADTTKNASFRRKRFAKFTSTRIRAGGLTVGSSPGCRLRRISESRRRASARSSIFVLRRPSYRFR
jgi:hypothetical protein